MKKTPIYLITALSGLFFFMACKKADLPGTGPEEEIAVASANSKKPASVPKVKTKMQGNDTRTFTYDTKGRLINSESSLTTSETFEYSGKTSITNNQYYNSGVLADQLAFTLNSDGLATSFTATNKQGTFTYNAARQKTKQEVTYSDGNVYVTNYLYVNGNLIQIISYHDGAVQWSEEYIYYNDQPNSLDHAAYGRRFFGAGSKNLAKKMIHVGNGIVYTEEYQYEFDAEAKVEKMKILKNGVQQPDVLFTYL